MTSLQVQASLAKEQKRHNLVQEDNAKWQMGLNAGAALVSAIPAIGGAIAGLINAGAAQVGAEENKRHNQEVENLQKKQTALNIGMDAVVEANKLNTVITNMENSMYDRAMKAWSATGAAERSGSFNVGVTAGATKGGFTYGTSSKSKGLMTELSPYLNTVELQTINDLKSRRDNLYQYATSLGVNVGGTPPKPRAPRVTVELDPRSDWVERFQRPSHNLKYINRGFTKDRGGNYVRN